MGRTKVLDHLPPSSYTVHVEFPRYKPIFSVPICRAKLYEFEGPIRRGAASSGFFTWIVHSPPRIARAATNIIGVRRPLSTPEGCVFVPRAFMMRVAQHTTTRRRNRTTPTKATAPDASTPSTIMRSTAGLLLKNSCLALFIARVAAQTALTPVNHHHRNDITVEVGDVHQHQGNAVRWTASAFPCPTSCGLPASEQVLSGASLTSSRSPSSSLGCSSTDTYGAASLQ